MLKKKSREDLAFPIATIPKLSQAAKPIDNQAVIKQIITGAVKGAYGLKTPSEPNSWESDYGKKQKPLVTGDQIELVTHLIESLEPKNAIEAALASQFVISYVRGLKKSEESHTISQALDLFRFGHEVLETLTKFRTKGAQLINVQYNHNQGQINNIHMNKKNNSEPFIEVNNEQ